MASENIVILIGYLGKDLVLEHTSNGIPKVTLSVGSSTSQRNQQGQVQKKTAWNYVTVWRQQAQFLAQYARKGSHVYIRGSVETVRIDRGNGKSDFVTNINARLVRILDRNPNPQQGQGYSQGQSQGYSQQPQNQGNWNANSHPNNPQSPPQQQNQQPQWQNYPNSDGWIEDDIPF